ncbi:integral membrane protein [Campylobacter insulaenigrae]|uniref:hypothetical protein n=1 Tax=Campylobacter insulaenigrae TaxID=260714 RepID=UPI000F6D82A0|nr:hypothetical protein [Campylobacter insulaenigrae]VEJ53510.1 integral membrane protein [Campylobacter insulaenigrae]
MDSFFVFYHVFVDWFQSKLKLGRYLLVIFTLCAYLFLYVLDVFLAYLDNQQILSFGFEYVWFFVLEALVSFVIFKGKI